LDRVSSAGPVLSTNDRLMFMAALKYRFMNFVWALALVVLINVRIAGTLVLSVPFDTRSALCAFRSQKRFAGTSPGRPSEVQTPAHPFIHFKTSELVCSFWWGRSRKRERLADARPDVFWYHRVL